MLFQDGGLGGARGVVGGGGGVVPAPRHPRPAAGGAARGAPGGARAARRGARRGPGETKLALAERSTWRK